MLLKIENLKVHFKTDLGLVKAVDGVDLAIQHGERFTLIGESGSGKSVLAVSILRLLPKNARISGKVIFDGKNLLELDEEEMRSIRGRKIAWVPQSQTALNPVLTVGFQSAEPMMQHLRLDKRSAWSRVLRIFESLGIGKSRAKDYPHQFSGGMRQRVLVAMGISTNPELIIADEPTKGLDSSKRNQVIELFRRISDRTMLIITHDLHFAEALASRIAVMYCGKIVEVCKAKDFFKDPLHPYSKGLLDSLPSRGLKPIRGFQPSMINPPKGCRFRERCSFASERCKIEPPLLSVDGRFVRCWLYD
jgi:peptide/nickel transport system ATP-binding protein